MQSFNHLGAINLYQELANQSPISFNRQYLVLPLLLGPFDDLVLAHQDDERTKERRINSIIGEVHFVWLFIILHNKQCTTTAAAKKRRRTEKLPKPLFIDPPKRRHQLLHTIINNNNYINKCTSKLIYVFKSLRPLLYYLFGGSWRWYKTIRWRTFRWNITKSLNLIGGQNLDYFNSLKFRSHQFLIRWFCTQTNPTHTRYK